MHCDISSISSNLKATLEISPEEVAQCFRGVYLLLTFSAMKRWMGKKKKTKNKNLDEQSELTWIRLVHGLLFRVRGAYKPARRGWATGLALLGQQLLLHVTFNLSSSSVASLHFIFYMNLHVQRASKVILLTCPMTLFRLTEAFSITSYYL